MLETRGVRTTAHLETHGRCETYQKDNHRYQKDRTIALTVFRPIA